MRLEKHQKGQINGDLGGNFHNFRVCGSIDAKFLLASLGLTITIRLVQFISGFGIIMATKYPK